MLFCEIITVYSENYTKHINSLCAQNAELMNVNAGGTQNKECASNFKILNFLFYIYITLSLYSPDCPTWTGPKDGRIIDNM
jgi:hypothetical protein